MGEPEREGGGVEGAQLHGVQEAGRVLGQEPRVVGVGDVADLHGELS